MTKSSGEATLQRGYVRLEGSSNYDKWVFTCKAQWAQLGILYLLTAKDPRPQSEGNAQEVGDLKQVPLSQTEIDDMQRAFKQREDNEVSVANSVAMNAAYHAGQAIDANALRIADYSQMPDYADLTRDETVSEKRARIAKYESDLSIMWSAIISSCADEPMTVVRQAEAQDGLAAFNVLKPSME